jgi:hypothetical protein
MGLPAFRLTALCDVSCRSYLGETSLASAAASSDPVAAMPANESAQHLELKRLALGWAQTHGYRIAAAEVSVPNLGARIDVAGFRPPALATKRRPAPMHPAGVSIIFECKQSRADFLKDSRCREQISARLAKLHERRERYEEGMRRHMPTLRQADTLFPEFDTYRYEAAGYEPYDKLTAELRTLAGRLHAQTKFADLIRWRAANLHYVVAEPGVARAHELPAGWGLLVRADEELRVEMEPTWQEATEAARMMLLLRIAMAGTRAVHSQLGVVSPWAPIVPRRSHPQKDPPLKKETRNEEHDGEGHGWRQPHEPVWQAFGGTGEARGERAIAEETSQQINRDGIAPDPHPRQREPAPADHVD